MDVGLELRQAREQRGISLQQISHTTKISLRVLQAIEASDESRLLANVFTRSFVRTYAAQVGLDPDATARRYLEQFEPAVPPETPGGPRESIPDTESTSETPGRGAARVLRGRFGTATALLLTAVTVSVLVARNRHEHALPTRTAVPSAVSSAGVVPAATPQAVAVGTSGTASTVVALHLTIAPTGACWVRATVDGQPVLAALLAGGDRRDVDTRSDVTLRVGDAGACAFSINGAPARVPGKPGEPVTVHVTRENYRTFLTR